jgi:peptidoglycan/LPS O-acetylase OafA/YrhL
MIQRLQSIFFFFAAICALCVLFFPVIELDQNLLSAQDNSVLFILSVVVTTVFIIAIFLFKNRPFQINVARLGLLMALALLVLTAYYENADGAFNIQWGAFLPVLSLVLGSLGIRYVNKDEKLVRGMDRLR